MKRGGMPGDGQTGVSPVMANVPCACGEKIPTPLTAILQSRTITCWNCGAKLSINLEKNHQSLEALNRLNQRLEKVRNGDG